MTRYADTMEKLVGRKIVSCFGFVLLILLALTILALAWLTGAGCQSPGTPADAAARLARAGEECQQGNWDGALADLDRVIKLTPDSAPAHQLRGQAKQVKGDFPGALG